MRTADRLIGTGGRRGATLRLSVPSLLRADSKGFAMKDLIRLKVWLICRKQSKRLGQPADLPEGPLLMSPSSLISAFHREVIEKKPEEFKISCLRDIQSLFPRNPFHSGFGNKVNDVKSYQSVDILISRIFTINPRGELRHEVSQAFLTSYTHLIDIADQVFPPVDTLKQTEHNVNAAHGYNSFVYWRDPLPEIVTVSE